MKLSKITNILLADNEYGTVIATPMLKEMNYTVDFKVKTGGGKVTGKGLATIPNDSLAVGTLAGLATHEIRKRFSKKKYTVHFFAKDIDDRKLYKKIVDDLIKTGLYKQTRKVHASGGILWELTRKS